MKSPTKLFFGLLGKPLDIEKIYDVIESEFGKIDAKTNIIPFTFTEYYTREMGQDLYRQWISIDTIFEENLLREIKKKTIKIENRFRISGKRIINIDPGGVLLSRVVLSTTKNYAHRIYLGEDIFMEVTLIYKGKSFQPLPWTYPDYKTEVAIQFFNEVRKIGFTKKR